MLNSKVIEILKSFSSGEIKRFSEFLNSPFHNKNKKAVQLFNLLSAYHPDYNNQNLTKEHLYCRIFPDKKTPADYNDASIRNLLSDLMILSENFLAYVNFEKDKFVFCERILKELSERKLPALFDKRLKSVEDVYLKKKFNNEEDYFKKYLLEELKSSSSQYSDDLKLYKSSFLANASDFLTYYFLIRIFKTINFFEWQKQYNIENKTNIAEKLIGYINKEEILEMIKDKSNDDYLILSVYFKMFLALKNPDNDDFYFQFREFLISNDKLFSSLEQYGLYICLTNCCIKKIDTGKSYFQKECFGIYKIMFENKLFDSYPGYFSMTTFTAVVNTGINSGEYDVVEKFVYEYSPKLNPGHRKDAVNYSFAQLNFSRKRYKEALEFVSITDTEFTNFKYLLKIISLKSFYELSDYESLYYTSDSFSHFLSKNKFVADNYRNEFSYFIKLLDLLVKYKDNKCEKILDKINMHMKKKSFAGKTWMKEKLSELTK